MGHRTMGVLGDTAGHLVAERGRPQVDVIDWLEDAEGQGRGPAHADGAAVGGEGEGTIDAVRGPVDGEGAEAEGAGAAGLRREGRHDADGTIGGTAPSMTAAKA